MGWKNIAYSEGFDDYACARLRLEQSVAGDPVAVVFVATAEVGQGFVTLVHQIVSEELGVDAVLAPAATNDVGSAGSTSASRQTWMSGGALQAACIETRRQLLERAARQMDCPASRLRLEHGDVVDPVTTRRVSLAWLLDEGPIETEQEYHHAPTRELDANGQGNAHLSMMYVAHRAVADVDPDLGLVRVVEVATAQDIGAAVNPTQVTGQIEGGTAQGLGLAVMEEIVLSDGRVRNPSFTDYLIPTTLDCPPVVATLIEEPEPDAPFGAKGVGEPPIISSGPAVLAAVRDATGLPLARAPIRPEDIALHPANIFD